MGFPLKLFQQAMDKPSFVPVIVYNSVQKTLEKINIKISNTNSMKTT
jgi:hypothetical protein